MSVNDGLGCGRGHAASPTALWLLLLLSFLLQLQLLVVVVVVVVVVVSWRCARMARFVTCDWRRAFMAMFVWLQMRCRARRCCSWNTRCCSRKLLRRRMRSSSSISIGNEAMSWAVVTAVAVVDGSGGGGGGGGSTLLRAALLLLTLLSLWLLWLARPARFKSATSMEAADWDAGAAPCWCCMTACASEASETDPVELRRRARARGGLRTLYVAGAWCPASPFGFTCGCVWCSLVAGVGVAVGKRCCNRWCC